MRVYPDPARGLGGGHEQSFRLCQSERGRAAALFLDMCLLESGEFRIFAQKIPPSVKCLFVFFAPVSLRVFPPPLSICRGCLFVTNGVDFLPRKHLFPVLLFANYFY